MLGAIDTEARKTMAAAAADLAPIVAREAPRGRTGKVASAMRPRVSRTATGQSLVIAPPRRPHSGKATIAQVVRWVTRGTGLYRTGPGVKSRIRASNPWQRLVLPGGKKVWSVRGQHPNAFVDRIRSIGTPRVERVLQEGAEDAARAVERIF